MLWEIEISPIGRDVERQRVIQEYDLLTQSSHGKELVERASRGFLVQGDVDSTQAESLLNNLLLDPLVEDARLLDCHLPRQADSTALTVSPSPV
jgi:hypothetical protein